MHAQQRSIERSPDVAWFHPPERAEDSGWHATFEITAWPLDGGTVSHFRIFASPECAPWLLTELEWADLCEGRSITPSFCADEDGLLCYHRKPFAEQFHKCLIFVNGQRRPEFERW